MHGTGGLGMSEYKRLDIEEISSMGCMAYKAALNLDDYLYELTGMKPKELAKLSKAKADDRWIPVSEKLPSIKNGCVDRLVLICVKNKNKEDGIYLQDISSFDGESWSRRINTWEDILFWRPLPTPPEGE